MFYVYGVTKKDCRKAAMKIVDKMKDVKGPSDYEERVERVSSELFKTMKPKCISGELSCPERVRQFIDLAKKDETVCRVIPMKKIPKLDGNGDVILTKRTGKPTFQIVQMGDL